MKRSYPEETKEEKKNGIEYDSTCDVILLGQIEGDRRYSNAPNDFSELVLIPNALSDDKFSHGFQSNIVDFLDHKCNDSKTKKGELELTRVCWSDSLKLDFSKRWVFGLDAFLKCSSCLSEFLLHPRNFSKG